MLKLKESYGIWQNYLTHFPKANRFTLGSKIDDVFLSSIEFCFLASYSPLGEKVIILNKAIGRVDLLKLLLALAWDIGAIDANKYAHLGEKLVEAGKMLGGWKRQILNKTPEGKFRENA